MLKGQIIKNISDTYVVNHNNILYKCKARGKFRNMGLTPLVGDRVEFDETNGYILEILPRHNFLDRPSISNIDVALIVTSVKKPDLSLNLLDKEICNIIIEKIEPVICFTKIDLLDKNENKELQKIIKYYKSLNIKVFTNQKLNKLIKYLKHKTIVLTGQTGAGKSSLINKLDKELNLQVGEISEALNRGKHTTRHTEFFLVKDMFIADTPGFSSLDLSKYSAEQIKSAFNEFNQYQCEYKNCLHIKEQNCEIRRQVKLKHILPSRYENYCAFIKEVNK